MTKNINEKCLVEVIFGIFLPLNSRNFIQCFFTIDESKNLYIGCVSTNTPKTLKEILNEEIR